MKLTSDERARLEAIAAECDSAGLRAVRSPSGKPTLSPKPTRGLARRIRQLGAAFRLVLEAALREKPKPRYESRAGWASVSNSGGDGETEVEHIRYPDGSETRIVWKRGGW